MRATPKLVAACKGHVANLSPYAIQVHKKKQDHARQINANEKNQNRRKTF
jgi:hypothetical protein